MIRRALARLVAHEVTSVHLAAVCPPEFLEEARELARRRHIEEVLRHAQTPSPAPTPAEVTARLANEIAQHGWPLPEEQR